MDVDRCVALRNGYAYPPAHLVRPPVDALRDVTWAGRHYIRNDPHDNWRQLVPEYSSLALDQYHSGLLNSDHPNHKIDGVVSSVYWGHFADRYGAPNGYVVARTAWLLEGRNGGPPPSTTEQIAQAVERASGHLAVNEFGQALASIDQIQYIGLSFASKVVAFLDPIRCGVLDNVVAARLKASGDPRLNQIRMSATGFHEWCNILCNSAHELNQANAHWLDWDCTERKWRAIDVERVVFACPNDEDPAPIILN